MHSAFTLGSLLEPESAPAIGTRGAVLFHALQAFLLALSVIGLSACALQQTVMLEQADAQYRLGLQALVADPPDYGQAVEHFRAAAIRDHAEAQRQLGRLYASSSPRPDVVRAYLWLYLASRSDPDARRDLDVLSQLMTAEQIGTARVLAAGFVPGKPPDVAPEPAPDAAPDPASGSPPAVEEQPPKAR